MRYSGDPADPGYANYAALNRTGLRVFCDGRELRDVITADDACGFALVFDFDANRKARLDGNEIATRVIRGRITFKLNAGFAPEAAKPAFDVFATNREFSS